MISVICVVFGLTKSYGRRIGFCTILCLNYSPVCVLSFAVELFLPSQVHPFVWFVSFYFSFLLVFFFVVSIAIQHLKCSVFLLIFGKFVLLFDLIIWMKVCLVFIENFWYYDILSIVMLFMCDCIFFLDFRLESGVCFWNVIVEFLKDLSWPFEC